MKHAAHQRVTEEACQDCLVGFGPEKIREDFPALRLKVHGKPLVYLDNAATTQKPQVVIDALTRYYTEENSNVHRGVHFLSQVATQAYDGGRTRVRRFLNAAHDHEIVFTRGTTDGINLVAQSYGRKHLRPGDEVIISAMEHHSNIVPWQMICDEKRANLKVVPITDAGELRLDEYERMLTDRTKLVAVVHVSNALGTVNPIREMIALAHHRGIPVLVDGAQAIPHTPLDVQEMDCDFYAFSGHKLFGPTGIGVLYGKAELLEAMPPYQGGGDMIRTVTFEKTTFTEIPHKFEAGTPDIGGAVVLGAAIDYVGGIGLAAIAAHERDLLERATSLVEAIPRVRIVGTAREKASVLSFVIEGIHPHDVGTVLDSHGIAIRAGHLCAQPVMERFGLAATARASFGLYNTRGEVDVLGDGIRSAIEVLG